MSAGTGKRTGAVRLMPRYNLQTWEPKLESMFEHVADTPASGPADNISGHGESQRPMLNHAGSQRNERSVP